MVSWRCGELLGIEVEHGIGEAHREELARWLCGELLGNEVEHGIGEAHREEVARRLCGELLRTEVEQGKWVIAEGGGWHGVSYPSGCTR